MTRSIFLFIVLGCALSNAAVYQLNTALSAAISTVNITETYQVYFGSAPSAYPPACGAEWPELVSGSDLDNVLTAKKLRLGYSARGNTPFVIESDTSSKLTGFDVEYAAALASALSEHYGTEVNVEWVGLPIPNGFFDGLRAGLDAGDVDAIMSGITNTPDRELLVDFTCDYFPSAIGGITTNQDLTTYESLNQAGVKVGYQTGTISAELVVALTEATTVAASSTYEGLALVENGTVDYFIMAQPQATYFAQSLDDNIVASPFVFPNSESYMSIGTPLPKDQEPISVSQPVAPPSPSATPTKAPSAPTSSASRATGWFGVFF